MIKQLYKKIVPEKKRVKLIQQVNRFFAFLYHGSNFYCNYCQQNFRKFKSKGNGIILRENAVCPKCESNERTRLLLEFLKQETAVFSKPLRVLHIAPENCLFKLLKKTNCKYIDGDINPALATYKVDITQIDYLNNYFDIIICAHVLGHVPNEKKAINELYRVLNNKGKLLIQTLIGNNEITLENNSIITAKDKLENYGEHDLVRLHGKDFSKRLERKKTKVTTIDYRKQFTKEENRENGFGNGQRELIFLCEKKDEF